MIPRTCYVLYDCIAMCMLEMLTMFVVFMGNCISFVVHGNTNVYLLCVSVHCLSVSVYMFLFDQYVNVALVTIVTLHCS